MIVHVYMYIKSPLILENDSLHYNYTAKKKKVQTRIQQELEIGIKNERKKKKANPIENIIYCPPHFESHSYTQQEQHLESNISFYTFTGIISNTCIARRFATKTS